jgi:hypothetical protein
MVTLWGFSVDRRVRVGSLLYLYRICNYDCIRNRDRIRNRICNRIRTAEGEALGTLARRLRPSSTRDRRVDWFTGAVLVDGGTGATYVDGGTGATCVDGVTGTTYVESCTKRGVAERRATGVRRTHTPATSVSLYAQGVQIRADGGQYLDCGRSR